MKAHDDPVRLAPRLADLAEVLLRVLGVVFRGNIKIFAQDVALALKLILNFTGDAELRGSVKTVVDYTLALRVESQPGTDLSQRVETFPVNHESSSRTEGIDPGFSGKIDALMTCPAVG